VNLWILAISSKNAHFLNTIYVDIFHQIFIKPEKSIITADFLHQ
jgi:hypothetical protein